MAMKPFMMNKCPNTPKGMEGGWKYGGNIDVGGKKKMGEKGGEEGIYMSRLGSEPGGPSILGKVGCLEKGKYHRP